MAVQSKLVWQVEAAHGLCGDHAMAVLVDYVCRLESLQRLCLSFHVQRVPCWTTLLQHDVLLHMLVLRHVYARSSDHDSGLPATSAGVAVLLAHQRYML
jgi:hypothetical protein